MASLAFIISYLKPKATINLPENPVKLLSLTTLCAKVVAGIYGCDGNMPRECIEAVNDVATTGQKNNVRMLEIIHNNGYDDAYEEGLYGSYSTKPQGIVNQSEYGHSDDIIVEFLPLKIKYKRDHDAFPLLFWSGVSYVESIARDTLENVTKRDDLKSLAELESFISDQPLYAKTVYQVMSSQHYRYIGSLCSGLATHNGSLLQFTRSDDGDWLYGNEYTIEKPSWVTIKIVASCPYIDLPPYSHWVPKHQRMMNDNYRLSPYI
jgi:hypothetical protein